jgi:GT2 family glycosyltransferase
MEQSRPFISVIIPTYERAGQLYVCLGALAAQDYPRDRFEVVVVDDGSSTSPDSSVETFRHQLDVRLLKQLHSGPAAARNYGAAQAKGAFLAFTDDDCTPAVGWLQSLATYFVSCSNCAIGGRTINGLANNPYSTVSQLVVDYLYTKWNHGPMHMTFFTSNNLALPAQSFHAVGGFDVGWTRAAGEDLDLCDRLVAHGCRLMYAPEALVRHAHFLTFRTFWGQHFNYGRGAYRLHQLRARRDARSIRIESLAFYLSMIGYPFYRTPYRRAVVLAALIGVAQLATAVGFFLERTAQGRHLELL